MQELKIVDDPFVSPEKRLAALKEIVFDGNLSSSAGGEPASKIDLHVHTNYSDGYWTPSGLILEACQKGMDLIALTDHDGFAGVEEAFNAVRIVNERVGVDLSFVPGVEFSTNYYYGDGKKKEIHVLGYFPSRSFDHFSAYLNRLDSRVKVYMEAFQKNRVLRIYEMVSKFNWELPSKVPLLAELRKFQDPIISDKTVFRGMRNSIAPGRLLTSTGIYDLHSMNINGRVHEIEDESFSEGYLEVLSEVCTQLHSSQDFMKEFFDKKQPSAKTGYIGVTESPEWAVKTVQQMGGIPVLAHPAKYPDLTEDLLNLLVPVGLKGVEVFSDHFKDEAAFREMIELTRAKYPELTVTIGSDCHGFSTDREIDYTPNNVFGLKKDFGEDITAYMSRIYDLFGMNR